GTGGYYLACAAARIGTTICPGNSRKADHALRLKPDHLMGSGQASIHVAFHVASICRASLETLGNQGLPVATGMRHKLRKVPLSH
ncbi:MAG: hypothetical protein WA973_12360, partial [Mesorhizobium sp.]